MKKLMLNKKLAIIGHSGRGPYPDKKVFDIIKRAGIKNVGTGENG